MDIYEQYFSKQLGYSYYKYTGQNWYDKGIDSLVMNKTSDPYYIYELLEIEQDDYLYFPILDKKDSAHRFITSEADYIFYFKKFNSKLYSGEPQVIRKRIKDIWQEDGAKYKNLPLCELSNGSKYIPLPNEEFKDIFNEHEINSAVVHLLKNY